MHARYWLHVSGAAAIAAEVGANALHAMPVQQSIHALVVCAICARR